MAAEGCFYVYSMTLNNYGTKFVTNIVELNGHPVLPRNPNLSLYKNT